MLEFGVLEVFIILEGNEFVIDRLYKGSILNYRTFFMEDLNYVFVRCATSVTVLYLTLPMLNNIIGSHSDMEKYFLSYQNNILKKNKNYPLDYILKLPSQTLKDQKAQR